ncbi:hypothetical protein PCL_09629 [Purpureocillium lilacinum]|uniref:Uncharacterized protein n=1 Tax=Purpureocillium lilacinum TaxID=33203 RepID=A0A2U3DQF8_PURLI|nr:hypothetical protein PCL_09629 [Purpureocillium lilacinum]
MMRLKHYYRKRVGFLSLLTGWSPVGKQKFLSCYQRACEQALTACNIKGGWKATDASQIWSTPTRPQDLKVQVLGFNQLDDDVPTKRLLFRKITKRFDEKNGLLAKAQLQIQALETQFAAVKPKKRKRVETSPDSRFAEIEAVRRAQDEVKAAENKDSDGTEAELTDIGDDCIVVHVGRQ